MARLRYSGLTATLGGSGLTTSATAVTFGAALTYNGAAATPVPTLSGSDYIPLTMLDSSGNVSEIVSLTAYTSGATTGTISRGQEGTTGVAHSSGDKVVHGPTTGDFGVDDTWHNVSTFSNSWVNYGGSEPVAAYVKDPAGNTHIRGTIKAGSVGSAAFVLPTGYRPTATMHFTVLTNNGSSTVLGEVAVGTDGSVGVYAPAANGYVRLDPVSFPTI